MRIELKALFTSFVALSSAALLAGCPGKLRDPERFVDGGTKMDGGTNNCPDVPTEIFIAKCGSSTCHGGTTPAQGLDLAAADVASRVVGKSATECQGILADPADPEGSVLYVKVAPGDTCGSRMPLGSTLTDAQIACVKEWIASQTPGASTSASSSASSSASTGGGGGGAGGMGGAGGGT